MEGVGHGQVESLAPGLPGAQPEAMAFLSQLGDPGGLWRCVRLGLGMVGSQGNAAVCVQGSAAWCGSWCLHVGAIRFHVRGLILVLCGFDSIHA